MNRMEIKNWYMKYRDYAPLSCEAPCSMYTVLLDHKLIKDPYYGLNDQETQGYSDYPCEFVGHFRLEKMSQYVELIFEGLDTICDIYLNGKRLDSVKNMHRTFRYQVKDRIVEGENTIRLVFSSPSKFFERMDKRHHMWINAETIPGAAYLRKALYMSGWNWCPVLPDMGIFKPVTIRQYDVDAIEDVEIRQIHEDEQVTLEFYGTTRHQDANCDIYVEAAGQRICLEDGYGEITVTNPKLWWPNGYGEQPLYDVVAELIHEEQVIDSVTKTIGLRTIMISRDHDKYGQEFCFEVNGIKIFAMGANYIPEDNLITKVTKEQTERLLQSCLDAHFNCIRVWGGGCYPTEEFYDFCDRHGLIVWQDYMVACAHVFLGQEFKENILLEFEEQTKRIRHRASLGLLCGNNEIEDNVRITIAEGKEGELVRMDYLELYEKCLADICNRLAPDVFYWPSSPSNGGGFDIAQDPTRGDQHYWMVWCQGAPISDYRKYMFRFCSEYGFQSLPSMKTVRSFAEPKDYNLLGRVMENHQKWAGGNQRLLHYIADHYLYPAGLEHLVYTSQILQTDALSTAVSHFRRIRGCCMGSLYWQLNDCCPIASWSSIDYFGRYKASHYAMRKLYAPIACALFYEDGKVIVNVANETRQDFKGSIKTYLCRSDFTVLDQRGSSFEVEALSSEDVYAVKKLVIEDIHQCYFYAELFDENGNFLMQQTLLFTQPKSFEWQNPNICAECKDVEGGVEIMLTSDCFAKYVEIDFTESDLILSDNYLDITSSAPVTVRAKTSLKATALQRQMRLQSVYDIDK